MRPSDVLIAKSQVSDVNPKKGSITVSGIMTDKIVVIGASLPISVLLGETVNSFSVCVEEGKKGIIAVSIYTDRWNKKYSDHVQFFLSVRWDEKLGPFIDLNDSWVPAPERLGQLRYKYLEVTIGGICFTTDKSLAEKRARTRYVPDANLLCRFLVGEIGPIEVRARASEYVEEVSAQKALLEVLAKFQELRRELQDERDQHRKTYEKLEAWRSAAIALKAVVEATRRFKKRISVMAALRQFPPPR